MTSKNSIDSIKLAKLQGVADFPEWKRLIKVYIPREDILLLGLKKSPQGIFQAANSAWNKAKVQAKSDVILSLGPQTQVRARSIIDDDD